MFMKPQNIIYLRVSIFHNAPSVFFVSIIFHNGIRPGLTSNTIIKYHSRYEIILENRYFSSGSPRLLVIFKYNVTGLVCKLDYSLENKPLECRGRYYTRAVLFGRKMVR